MAEPLNNYNQNIDTEKPQDNDDGDVKKWKGMKEDPKTGKFIVYITESEEFVFDSPDEAIDFMINEK